MSMLPPRNLTVITEELVAFMKERDLEADILKAVMKWYYGTPHGEPLEEQEDLDLLYMAITKLLKFQTISPPTPVTK